MGLNFHLLWNYFSEILTRKPVFTLWLQDGSSSLFKKASMDNIPSLNCWPNLQEESQKKQLLLCAISAMKKKWLHWVIWSEGTNIPMKLSIAFLTAMILSRRRQCVLHTCYFSFSSPTCPGCEVMYRYTLYRVYGTLTTFACHITSITCPYYNRTP